MALYGPRGRVWCLTDRAIAAGDCAESSVVLGRSRVAWERGSLVVDVDERTAPFGGLFGRPVRGRITLHPTSSPLAVAPLDEAGAHLWWPVAPRARVEVALSEPDVRFAGEGYHDANAGPEPLEAAFRRWTWSRAHAPDGRTLLVYDVELAGGARRSRRIAADPRGREVDLARTTDADVGRTLWRLSRVAARDEGARATLRRTLEDTPFYARSLVDTTLGGARVVAMHEELSLERLGARWTQHLLSYRMGRPSWAR